VPTAAQRDHIHSLDDPSAQSLLHSVLAEYDALQFERVGQEMAQMLARVRAVEGRRRRRKSSSGSTRGCR
jgi:hypothetical protein